MVQINFAGEVLDTPRTLRIQFHKVGALQYISHLDLMRTMTRVMARAHLPIRYTAGFSPKPHLVFSAPLPVGAQSLREFVDVAVLRAVDPAEVVAALNEGLPPELAVEKAYYATTKMGDVSAAVYVVKVYTPKASCEMAERCDACLQERPMLVHKRTKSGEKDVDIRSSILASHAVWDETDRSIEIAVRLVAEGGSFLNPAYIMQYLRNRLGLLAGSAHEEWYTVTRTHLYDKKGNEFC